MADCFTGDWIPAFLVAHQTLLFDAFGQATFEIGYGAGPIEQQGSADYRLQHNETPLFLL